MTETRLPEPGVGGFAQIGAGPAAGQVYGRSDLLAWGSEARWFRLTDDDPKGVPVESEPGITWAGVLALGALNRIGEVRSR